MGSTQMAATLPLSGEVMQMWLTRGICHLGIVPSGEQLSVGKTPPLFVYFAINVAVVIVLVLFHCFVLSVNCYCNP